VLDMGGTTTEEAIATFLSLNPDCTNVAFAAIHFQSGPGDDSAFGFAG
jgi:hypothetical protein